MKIYNKNNERILFENSYIYFSDLTDDIHKYYSIYNKKQKISYNEFFKCIHVEFLNKCDRIYLEFD